MESIVKFDDIRPYRDEEVAPIIEKLLEDTEFKRVIHFIMPEVDWDEFKAAMRSFDKTFDFQNTMVKNLIFALLNKSVLRADGLANRSCQNVSTSRQNTTYNISEGNSFASPPCYPNCFTWSP